MTSSPSSSFDLQVNGYAGVDFNKDGLTAGELHHACERIEADEVDAFLATIITDHVDVMCRRLQTLARLRSADPLVARVMAGIHIEGPFINETDGYRGAHPIDAVRPADTEVTKRLLDAAGGLARLFTLAPERDDGCHVTRMLVAHGIVVSAGHCNPTLPQLASAVDAGVTMFTHVGNGCPLQLDRHDNIVQRALSFRNDLWMCFIADGVHVPFVALGNYLELVGPERAIVVTDATAASSAGPGRYTLGRREILVGDDGVPRSAGFSQLVGSGVTMKQSRHHLISELHCPASTVTALVSQNPRSALGIGKVQLNIRGQMRVGLIGTGAIANLHARAYKNIGFTLRACTDINAEAGRRFAAATGAEFIGRVEDVCSHAEVDFVDVCTFPNFRLEPVELCAAHGKHVQVQKPIATTLEIAQQMVATAARAGIRLGVVSQHRFDESSRFLERAIRDGRLGKLLQCDAYVKWHRSDEYYSRPVKGSWATEGGGALINQAIHQVDVLRWLAGPVREVFGAWQISAAHRIESEDIVNAVLQYANGASGVIQASTAFWPGYSERMEFHGAKGTAIVTGDRLTTWDVRDDEGDPAPIAGAGASGSSDPMAISLEPFERQFRDFGEAIERGRKPAVAGEEGVAALEIVDAIYRSCRTGQKTTPGERAASDITAPNP